MGLLDYFRSSRSNSATVAKERLQVIVAHERSQRNSPEYLPQLQREILQVIRRYVSVDDEHVRVNLDKDGDFEILELNILLPDNQAGSQDSANRQ